MSRRLDLKGKRFHKLFVLEFSHLLAKGYSVWKCKCDCGKTVIRRGSSIVSGQTKSCGCYRNRHGKSATKEYKSWAGAKSRCYNVYNPKYKNYGERGIKMSEKWVNSFQAFYNDLGKCPNNNGHYESNNCVWATAKEQARNRRSRFSIENFSDSNLLTEIKRRNL